MFVQLARHQHLLITNVSVELPAAAVSLLQGLPIDEELLPPPAKRLCNGHGSSRKASAKAG